MSLLIPGCVWSHVFEIFPFLGLLISGGFNGGYLASAEVYIPALNQSCLLPNMTTNRTQHSQNNLLACGGYGRPTSCEVFTPGVGWRPEPYRLREERRGHTSWTLSNGSVLLLGGEGSYNTTEIITPGLGTRPGFGLRQQSQ